MKLTVIDKDFIVIDENNLNETNLLHMDKIHLIKLNFTQPTREKIENVINAYPKTNRFIISNNIKIYNDILKMTTKKYYVENETGNQLITFLRKNNKILLNFNNLRPHELSFVLQSNTLYDILKNTEVIMISKEIYDNYKNIFNQWDGNIILTGDENEAK